MTRLDLDELFETERTFEEMPAPEACARIREGIVATLALPGLDDDGGSGEGNGGGGLGGGSVRLTHAALGMLGTFVVGGVVGGIVVHMTDAPGKPSAAASIVATSAPPPIVIGNTTPSSSSERIELPSPRPVSSSATTASTVDPAGAIAAERALLDSARVAIANGEPQRAVELLDRHAKTYPRGRLIEEREALAVRVLVKVGRYDEARHRGASFKTTWPRSLAAPAVDAALESIP